MKMRLYKFNSFITVSRKFPFIHRRIYLTIGSMILMWFLFKSIVNHVEKEFHRKNIMLYDFQNKIDKNKSSCQIPDYDPFDESIKKFIAKWPAIDCGTPQLPLTYLDDNGFIHVNESAVKESKIPRDHIKCFYQEIIRPPNDDFQVELGDPEYFNAKERVYATYIVVQCYDREELIYKSYHLQVLPLEPELDLKSKKAALQENGINVLIFALDSMSRLNFIRQLPKTYQLITQDLKFDVFKGLTKVGDNTFPNMIAMLSGFAKYRSDKSFGPFITKTDVIDTFDDSPIIWKNFSANGYVTMYLDDATEYGMFNYFGGGFMQPPTNYYTRPFWLTLEKQTSILSWLTSDLRCIGHVPKHHFYMNFYEQFVNKMHRGQNAFFAFGMSDNLSHEKLNSVQVLDDDLAAFVTRLNTSGILDNTLMLLLGDHGHRFDNIRKTKIGRAEESMPFLGIHLPESLNHLQENLQKNLNILTSWHDVYETLMDVAMKNTALQSKQVRYGYHGLSLFRPISADRTCKEIGIPQQYCICSYEKELTNLNDPRVLDSAQLLVNHVNKLLKPHANLCATLTLDAVISSQLVIPHGYSSRINPSDFETQIRVLISVQPSEAMLEGLVVTNAWSSKIEGDVSRINRFGNQSACINDVYIDAKMYCFCKQ